VALVIAGAPDPNCEPYVSELQNLVRRYRLSGRVTLLPHWVPQRQKIQLFSDCLAALYFPVDEDSYGYPSLEAHASRKAVLTTTDAGGTGELIVDGINGFVRPPDPQLIAEAMDFLYANRSAAKQMGEAGISRMLDLGIDWNHVVQRLLS
jgi:glycosyltransferase involved in cell wall biosynthesis